MKTRILTLLIVVLSAGHLVAQTPNELVAQGRNLLVSRDLKGAQAKFNAAVALNTNHPAANALLATTRLLLLPQQPAVSNFLNRLGIASTGRDIFNWTNDFTRDANGGVVFPANLNTTEAIDLIRSTLLPAVRNSQKNLTRITGTNFQLALTAAETGSEAVTVDYGDMQVLQAMLHAAEFMGLTLDTYNFSVVVNRLQELGEADQLSIQRVLDEYPALLNLTSPANLAASRAALTNAMARYLEGSEFIRTLRLAGVGLFTLDTPEQQADETQFRDYLTKARQSLDGPVKVSDEDDFYVYLGRYFSRANGLRDLLPMFHGDRYVWNSLPSYTLDGMLLGAPASEIENLLREKLGGREGYYAGQISEQGGVVASFAAFVSAQQRVRIGGLAYDPTNAFGWSFVLEDSNEWEGYVGESLYLQIRFELDHVQGTLCDFMGGDCLQLSGQRLPDVGPFQAAAGSYQGTATERVDGETITTTVRATMTPAGALYILALDESGEPIVAGATQLADNGSFQTVLQPGPIQIRGTLNRSAFTIAGTFEDSEGVDGTFSLSRKEALAPITGQPPAITAQPPNRTVPAGSSASFTVGATGTGPLYYQWYFDDQVLLNARSATFTRAKASLAHTGIYQVVVSSSFGAVTSRLARLTVTPETVPPTIEITAPPNGFVTTSDSVLLSGIASDNDRVARVEYRLNGGPVQPATGTTAWSVQLPLITGTNRVEVWSVDGYANVSASAFWSCEYAVYSPLHLAITPPGGGTVTGPTNGQPLIVGHGYRLRAFPAADYLFRDWSGDLPSSNANFRFLMQPNLTLQANFVRNPFIPAQGAYAGLFHPTNSPLSTTNSGGVTITLSPTGTLSGQLQFPAGTVAFGGKFALDQRTSVTVPAGAFPALTLQLELVGTNRIRGTVTSAAGEAALDSLRAATDLPTLRGRYTLIVPADGDPAHPGGDGGLTLRATRPGVVTISGWLGDGSVLQRTTSASEDGWVALFAPLYGGRGELLGWLQLPAGANIATNQLYWLKSRRPANALYPMGFTDIWESWLARYLPPLGSSNALDWSQGQASLSGGNLTNDVTQGLTVASNVVTVTKPNPLKLKLTFAPAAGSFSGTIKNPATGLTNVIHGVLLQPEGTGRGSFLGTNESGFIRLNPTP